MGGSYDDVVSNVCICVQLDNIQLLMVLEIECVGIDLQVVCVV